jgi:hypothetical protein
MYTPAKITKKIGKESITFYFGIGAFHIFCENRGIELSDIAKEFGNEKNPAKDQMGALADILCAAANFNLLARNEESKYNKYNAFVWIEQMISNDLDDIMNVVGKVQILGKRVTENKRRPKAKQGEVK